LAVEMMAEGSETPNGEQGTGPEGRPRRGEGDLFAERRARRAAESGEVALMCRAEAAEATVQTLERHVASLQQRLLEVEEERQRTDELLDAEREGVLEREHELRRVKQREYAEQQLRVEAEDRLASTDRESLAEIERLSQRLDGSEQEARALVLRLEGLQRQLAEAVPAETEATDEHEDASAQASGPARKGSPPQTAARVSQTPISASRPSLPAAQSPAPAARAVFREPVVLPPPHKHSLSWFARRRIRRKQRRMP
jgi:hypothetical protein